MTVVDRLAQSPDRLHVSLRSVTLVARPSVVSEVAIQINHQSVPSNLREHRRGRDRRAAPVALHERGGVHGSVRKFRWRLDSERDVHRRAQQIERPVNQCDARSNTKRVERSSRGDGQREAQSQASISLALTEPKDQSAAHSMSGSSNASRWSGVKSFESFNDSGGAHAFVSTTAPTSTGPATAPRPTSSIPTTISPWSNHARSWTSKSECTMVTWQQYRRPLHISCTRD